MTLDVVSSARDIQMQWRRGTTLDAIVTNADYIQDSAALFPGYAGPCSISAKFWQQQHTLFCLKL